MMLASLFMIVLQISVTSGIIIFAMVICSQRLNKIFSSKWKLWVWLLLAAHLLIPVSFSFARAPVRLTVSDAPIQLPPVWQIPDIPFRLYEAGTPALTTVELAALIWLAGTALFLLYHIIGYLSCVNRALRWSHTPKDVRLMSTLDDMRRAAGIRKNIPLLISPEISSPMIIGFLNSRLLLPAEDYTDFELYYIIKHELIHIKRRDVWYKLLLLCANAVHWFNPLMYFMLREAGKDLELACDDEVVKGLSFAERKEYSDTIFKGIRRQCFDNTMLAVSFYGGANEIKSRFANILSESGKRSGIMPGVIAVSCVLLAGSLIACERSGVTGVLNEYSQPEYYYITTYLEKFPAQDIFITLSAQQKTDVKTTASKYIEELARKNDFALPDYFDQYFSIRKLKDENELEQLKARGIADNRLQNYASYHE